MSVFTSVSEDEMRLFLQEYSIGELVELKGIAQGITNTNYFVNTTQNKYVLTIFETLKYEELPFYLELMRHLSQKGVVAPEPIAKNNGDLIATIKEKPASLISCLAGKDVKDASSKQCFSIGAMLAKMHLAGQDFEIKMPNPRFNHWWHTESEKLYSLLPEQDCLLLKSTLAFLDKNTDTHLPSGVIHADLFKDNVLMSGDHATGLIDFYYACNGSFIYDLAITLNDWAQQIDENGVSLNQDKVDHLIAGYESVRPLLTEEKEYLPIAQQAGCIRFWVSRAIDYYFPMEGEMTYVKNQNTFRDLLISLQKLSESN